MGRGKEIGNVKSVWDEELIRSIPGIKDIHVQKIWKYLILRPTTNSLLELPYDQWSVPAKVQTILKEEFKLSSSKISKTFDSVKNKTKKILVQLIDGHFIEAVIIEHVAHCTLCVSSQIGCKMGCKFCATGMFYFLMGKYVFS